MTARSDKQEQQTSPAGRKDTLYQCSFCGRYFYEVQKLIAGPGQISICDVCVDECVALLREENVKLTNISPATEDHHQPQRDSGD